jgi:uncharacterized protein YjbI with pentapeptide repeats
VSGSKARSTGATQAPDLVADELEDYDGDRLEVDFDLEAVRLQELSFAGLDAGSGSIARASLKGVSLAESRLRGLRLLDVVAEGVDASNGDWSGGTLRRAVFVNCRLTGLDLNEAVLENVTFRGCKLDYANLRFARLTRVTFDGCTLVDTDAQGSQVRSTRFTDCRMIGTDFSKAELEDVDLRGSELVLAGGMAPLRGTTITFLQLMELAGPLAAEHGITVADDE